MSDRMTVHAAKIPEAAQLLNQASRRTKGVEMVNACDDKPWVGVPQGFPASNVRACSNCARIVEANRSRRSDESAAIRPRRPS